MYSAQLSHQIDPKPVTQHQCIDVIALSGLASLWLHRYANAQRIELQSLANPHLLFCCRGRVSSLACRGWARVNNEWHSILFPSDFDHRWCS